MNRTNAFNRNHAGSGMMLHCGCEQSCMTTGNIWSISRAGVNLYRHTRYCKSAYASLTSTRSALHSAWLLVIILWRTRSTNIPTLIIYWKSHRLADMSVCRRPIWSGPSGAWKWSTVNVIPIYEAIHDKCYIYKQIWITQSDSIQQWVHGTILDRYLSPVKGNM